MRLAILLTCFNRRDTTLKALERLWGATSELPDKVDVYLTDDASSDGTADAVAKAYPDTHISHGDGNLFWGGGTNAAWKAAVENSETAYDYFVWLNDDTMLDADALSRNRACLEEACEQARIFVGSIVDPDSGEHTYGGILSGKRPMQQFMCKPADSLQRVQTFNGNFVFISRKAFDSLGFIDSYFHHVMGDTDYGFRATKLGIPIFTFPGVCGTCPRNPVIREPSMLKRIRNVSHPKNRPISAWARFCFRHGGLLSPLILINPYLKAVVGRY